MVRDTEAVWYVQEIAAQYSQGIGLPKPMDVSQVVIERDWVKRIAHAFDDLPVLDNNPTTLLAYQQMMNELVGQWRFAVANRIRFELHAGEGQPYEDSHAMINDVRENGRVAIFTGGQPHPVLSEVDSRVAMPANYVLRGVHDLFGHAAGGFNFGSQDEYRALLAHCQMFIDPRAIEAISTELGGQTQWFYHGQTNLGMPIEDRAFATQKVALLPSELTLNFRVIIEAGTTRVVSEH